MQKNNIRNSIFVLLFLIISSFSFFALAQENNSTANVFLDSDQDGLSDIEEKIYGTNPQKADTDGDGYSDGAEVSGGYDPLKPAPGDKIVTTTTKKPLSSEEELASLQAQDANLTQEIAAKVTALNNSNDPDAQKMTLDEINKLATETVNSKTAMSTFENIPPIDESTIKIKKQDYAKLSETERKAKLKEDATAYLVSLAYIFSSNSPYPITSSTSIEQVFFQKIQEALLAKDSSKLNDLVASGTKMQEQIKELEVPQDLLEFHKKALRLGQYALSMKKDIDPKPNDPFMDIANIGKIQGFADTLISFSNDMQTKIASYGITYDTILQEKLTNLGVPVPPVTTPSTTATTPATPTTTP